VKSLAWDRAGVVHALRADIWRYLTQAAVSEEDLLLETAALLDLSRASARRLAWVYFMLSEPVGRLLAEMPLLVRRLATTTTREEEWSAERVRGPILWATTLGARAATGQRGVYVTAPARRAYQTPENETLVFALDAIRNVGAWTGWAESDSADVGRLIRDRVAEAERWLRLRTLTTVERRPLSARALARVRAGRHRRRYQPALDVVAMHRRLVGRVDRGALRLAIENHALAAARDDVLLELHVAFHIDEALRSQGWQTRFPGLVRGGLFLAAERGANKLRVYYQHLPPTLGSGSVYGDAQAAHGIAQSPLRPDLVFELVAPAHRWILVEVKGIEANLKSYARSATFDLLAYRHSFGEALDGADRPWGLGVAWGSGLEPRDTSEVCLCTPDTLGAALQLLLG
jgi:hypothetical protein